MLKFEQFPERIKQEVYQKLSLEPGSPLTDGHFRYINSEIGERMEWDGEKEKYYYRRAKDQALADIFQTNWKPYDPLNPKAGPYAEAGEGWLAGRTIRRLLTRNRRPDEAFITQTTVDRFLVFLGVFHRKFVDYYELNKELTMLAGGYEVMMPVRNIMGGWSISFGRLAIHSPGGFEPETTASLYFNRMYFYGTVRLCGKILHLDLWRKDAGGFFQLIAAIPHRPIKKSILTTFGINTVEPNLAEGQRILMLRQPDCEDENTFINEPPISRYTLGKIFTEDEFHGVVTKWFDIPAPLTVQPLLDGSLESLKLQIIESGRDS